MIVALLFGNTIDAYATKINLPVQAYEGAKAHALTTRTLKTK